MNTYLIAMTSAFSEFDLARYGHHTMLDTYNLFLKIKYISNPTRYNISMMYLY